MSDKAVLRWLRCNACAWETPYFAQVNVCGDCRRRFTMHIISNVDGERPKYMHICPACRAVSYNQNDIDNRYCGRCKTFEEGH